MAPRSSTRNSPLSLRSGPTTLGREGADLSVWQAVFSRAAHCDKGSHIHETDVIDGCPGIDRGEPLLMPGVTKR